MIGYEHLRSELKQLFDEIHFNPQETWIHDIDQLALGVFPEPSEGQRVTASIVLAAGLVVPPDLKFLAWGMIDDHGELVGCGRTNAYGAFLATMPAGEYRIRYVAEPELDVDREILAAIDDAEARGMLREFDAATNPATDAATNAAAGALITDWLRGLVSTGAMADWGAGFAADDPTADTLADGEMIGLSRDRAWFCVDIPRENIPPEFAPDRFLPYGLLLVEYLGEDGHIVGSGLLPVCLNARGHYVGQIRVDQIVASNAPEPRRFRWTHIGREDDDVIAGLNLGDLRSLLNQDVVRIHSALRSGIETLIRRLAGE